MTFDNVESIKEEMIANNFLPTEVEIGKVLRFQEAINRNEHSNFAFLNKVLESLNTLKKEGNMPSKLDPENDKNSDQQEPLSLDIESEPENDELPELQFRVILPSFNLRTRFLYILLK